ncbi:putative transcriptional regulator (plasmid) [Phaeobacter piscinae]|uniref:helix-turn-helix domain-containing protein n=1 Tax=Phaeobacter piscinae TaxID=1580596 RepID=UPI000C99E12A|nr:helix-turn-helix transcriptional regulator [Phaeobacter piscinae]AUR38374.1 putative transcriptional regulator [Phaeobacter piscinae]
MAHPVDIHVGKQIRKLRWLAEMTQAQLGEAVGVKFQQIQKYETGANRVSASRLDDIARVLGVSVLSFFPEDNADGAHEFTADEINLIRAYRQTTDTGRQSLTNIANSVCRNLPVAIAAE